MSINSISIRKTLYYIILLTGIYIIYMVTIQLYFTLLIVKITFMSKNWVCRIFLLFKLDLWIVLEEHLDYLSGIS